MSAPQTVAIDGIDIAYRHEQAESRRTGILWLSGFRSDMSGTKVEALAAHARQTGRPFLRFDYSGHGLSKGAFAEQTLSDWLAQSLHMFTRMTTGPLVVVGSSMGGYLGLLLYRGVAQEIAAALSRVRGLVLIAPAADMTEALLWAKLSDTARQTLLASGETAMASAYGEGYMLTRRLIEDGRRHLILADGLAVHCPVHILQGDEDPEVPWQHAHKTWKSLTGDDLRFTLIRGGDHRLSTARDLAHIVEAVESVCLKSEAAGP
jgi:pimeloyl-ACP methyl ester carboxylesterase